MSKALVWFRKDLRLSDNPAWARAVLSQKEVIPVYIWAEEEAGPWAMGGASCWWLHHALEDLDKQLRAVGSRLIVRRGPSEVALERLCVEAGISDVYWNRCYEPHRVGLDGGLKERLKAKGFTVWSGNATLVREPWEVATQAGQPYKVYTPYSKACAKVTDPEPIADPGRPLSPEKWPSSESIEELGLLPRVGWDTHFYEMWKPSRAAALERMESFLSMPVQRYDEARDFPAEDGTSRLSPYLHFGQIGPREVLARVAKANQSAGAQVFYREIIWREFAYHVLYHFPTTPEQPLQLKYADFPWRDDADSLEAWKRGMTGYPIVDAGMRQLWQTGWMHNRVRMIVASFLVKHLLIGWHVGACWFWDTLVDADLASNTLGWQWAGGCGADAAPYFRIFNPITQGEKFDAEGHYIRKYVPELSKVPLKYLHVPWEMNPTLQAHSECRIGEDYPAPIVDHKVGRERALAALASLKGNDA